MTPNRKRQNNNNNTIHTSRSFRIACSLRIFLLVFIKHFYLLWHFMLFLTYLSLRFSTTLPFAGSTFVFYVCCLVTLSDRKYYSIFYSKQRKKKSGQRQTNEKKNRRTIVLVGIAFSKLIKCKECRNETNEINHLTSTARRPTTKKMFNKHLYFPLLISRMCYPFHFMGNIVMRSMQETTTARMLSIHN